MILISYILFQTLWGKINLKLIKLFVKVFLILSFQLKKLNLMDSTKPFLKKHGSQSFGNEIGVFECPFFNIRFNLSKVSFFIFQILLMDSMNFFFKTLVLKFFKMKLEFSNVFHHIWMKKYFLFYKFY